MDHVTIALICVVIGAIFIILETMSPGFFLLVPGIAAMAVGVPGLFIENFFEETWMVFSAIVIATILSTILTTRLYQVLAKPVPPETLVAETMVGKTGKITVATEPGTIKGKVRVGFDIWSATSEAPIGEGEDVVVYEAEGVHVKVKKRNQ